MRSQWLVSQLPPGMLTDDFFTRFVGIFQEQADTLLAHAQNMQHLADPTITPPAMLRWLASWIGLDGVDAAMPEDVQRRLVAGAARILARRGTPAGLRAFLELFSGGPATVTDGGGVWVEGESPADAAWVVMKVVSTGVLEEADFVALVQDEVPAHVRAELWVGSRRVWPVDGARAVAVAAEGGGMRPYGEEGR
ncbi:phage tail protein [Georgenia yuyongxinii]